MPRCLGHSPVLTHARRIPPRLALTAPALPSPLPPWTPFLCASSAAYASLASGVLVYSNHSPLPTAISDMLCCANLCSALLTSRPAPPRSALKGKRHPIPLVEGGFARLAGSGALKGPQCEVMIRYQMLLRGALLHVLPVMECCLRLHHTPVPHLAPRLWMLPSSSSPPQIFPPFIPLRILLCLLIPSLSSSGSFFCSSYTCSSSSQ